MIGLRDDSDSLPAPPPPSRAPEQAARIFAADGVLTETLKLEHRPQQEHMARAVAATMHADEPLLFEAGTGVGKSLAYLLPGIVHAMDQSRQMIVSTHTIALQEQLEQKDLPLCRRVFSADEALKPYAAFKSAVLVGKGNYLCTTRLADALKEQDELLISTEKSELLRIAEWARTAKEGLRQELNPPPSDEVWELVSADSSTCSRKNCDHEVCFYQRAKRRVDTAHVVIVNHSLLFALIRVAQFRKKPDKPGVVFANDFVILDEAHTVPDVATDNFGLSISSYGVARFLKTLYNPRTRRGFLVRLKFARDKDLLAVEDSLEACTHFFASIQDKLLTDRAITRVREPGIVEGLMEVSLAQVQNGMDRMFSQLPEGKLRDDLGDRIARLQGYRNSIDEWLNLADEEHVYWAERVGRRQTTVLLRSAPIDVAPLLKKHLFEAGTAVVCASATLAMGGQIEPFQQRMGANEVRAAVEQSPFDFERHMRVYVATDVPLPTPKDARLALDVLADYIDFCTRRVSGGSLVLFTSYHDMRAIAEKLEPIYDGARRPFFMQGRDASRTELARQLRAAGNGVLFGTDSFWTGIDVPGDALSQVIITRLPFEVPTHPILEARTEWIRERGGNPFNELTLPDALIKFRQGIGRLIRTATDRGIITILDSRIVQKPYGRLFLECLPKRDHVRINGENRVGRFQPFS